MAKQQINRTETQVANGTTLGTQVAQTVTVEDNILPSPQELVRYQEIDPRIVDYFLEAAKKEQEHRHTVDKAKVEVVHKNDKRQARMNWWGMLFAFLSLLSMLVLSGVALYLDHPWISSIFGGTAIIGVISVFVNAGKSDNRKEFQ